MSRVPFKKLPAKEKKKIRSEVDAGHKADAGKARYDLIPSTALAGLARCLAYGANKYSDDNWSRVPDKGRRYYAALMRHVEAWRSGERIDPESGLFHLDHAMACLAFLRAAESGEVGTEPGESNILHGDVRCGSCGRLSQVPLTAEPCSSLDCKCGVVIGFYRDGDGRLSSDGSGEVSPCEPRS